MISFDPFLLELIRTQEEWDSLGQRLLTEILSRNDPLVFPVHEPPELSIVLVFYNKAHLSLMCLLGILKTLERPYEVIVVDNASTDETGKLLDLCRGLKVIRNAGNAGFGPACMQAVAEASGKYLLFLNNDAVLEHDSVEAALHNFTEPAIGAVGGKILLADGNLQEAGSILWRNGSALGYGRGQYPYAPRYSFRRPADYCSGAFLFTPRDLFNRLGGFDPALAPAYYEDTDYCMKVWKAGLQVIYEPRAVIRHYESASSGSNEAARPAMAAKQQVFLSRWGRELERHCLPSARNIVKARLAAASKGLRLLYLDDRVPHRGMGSGYTRSNDVLRELANLGHHVTCVPIAFPLGDLEDEYADISRDVELYDIAEGVEQLFYDYVPAADVIWISRPGNFNFFLEQLVKSSATQAKIVFDAEAIFADRERLEIQIANRNVPERVLEARLERELALARAADAVVVVSRHDQMRMQQAGMENVHILGHQLPPSPTANGFAARTGFLFLGAVANAGSPNADSMDYFCREIWPAVRSACGAQLTIAGMGTDEFLGHLQCESVRVLGRVDDLRMLYSEARVVVIPTRFAGGIPFKAHEAAAYGVPMVVSPLICDQLNWSDGSDLLSACDGREFAAACTRLYSNEELWRTLRCNALTRVICELDRKSFAHAVSQILNSIGAA